MKVSISKAADMVGITRATLYRHIEKKGISVAKDADDNPKIDVAELIRVYGDRVKPDGHSRKEDSDETDDTIQGKQDYTPQGNSNVVVEIEVLRERIDNLQNERQQSREQTRGTPGFQRHPARTPTACAALRPCSMRRWRACAPRMAADGVRFRSKKTTSATPPRGGRSCDWTVPSATSGVAEDRGGAAAVRTGDCRR